MKRHFTVLLLSLWSTIALTQNVTPEIISTSGETYQTSDMMIDWTLGEIATMTIKNSSQQVTQGFHQPRYTITNVSTLPEKFGNIKVFPNPTQDFLTIHLNLNQIRNAQLQCSAWKENNCG